MVLSWDPLCIVRKFSNYILICNYILIPAWNVQRHRFCTEKIGQLRELHNNHKVCQALASGYMGKPEEEWCLNSAVTILGACIYNIHVFTCMYLCTINECSYQRV